MSHENAVEPELSQDYRLHMSPNPLVVRILTLGLLGKYGNNASNAKAEKENIASIGFKCFSMKTRIAIGAIVGGVLITLLTGLVRNTPVMLVGAEHYGYPLAWLTRLIIAPEYFPWQVDYVNLVVDFIVWAIIVGVILFALMKRKK
jgi:hypothetical protein